MQKNPSEDNTSDGFFDVKYFTAQAAHSNSQPAPPQLHFHQEPCTPHKDVQDFHAHKSEIFQVRSICCTFVLSRNEEVPEHPFRPHSVLCPALFVSAGPFLCVCLYVRKLCCLRRKLKLSSRQR